MVATRGSQTKLILCAKTYHECPWGPGFTVASSWLGILPWQTAPGGVAACRNQNGSTSVDIGDSIGPLYNTPKTILLGDETTHEVHHFRGVSSPGAPGGMGSFILGWWYSTLE